MLITYCHSAQASYLLSLPSNEKLNMTWLSQVWMFSWKPHYTSWKMRCLQHLGKSNCYDKALYSLFCLLWKAENIPPKFFCYLDLLSFIFSCNSVCLDHSFTKVISNLLALYQISFYILPFSHFKEAKYNFFTFLWTKLGILLILPDTSTIKTLHPLVSSTSVFLQSLPLNCLLLEWPFQQQYPRRVPMNCSLSWFGKRMAPLSQMQPWPRDTYWPTSVPAFSFMNSSPRTAGRGTQISITTHSSIILR